MAQRWTPDDRPGDGRRRVERRSRRRPVTLAAGTERACRGPLRSVEEQYRVLATHLPCSLLVLVDADLRVLLVEGALPRQAPWFEPELFRGRALSEVVGALRPDLVPEVTGHHRAALAGEHHRFDVVTERRTFTVDVVPVGSGGDDIEAVLAVARDVTGDRSGGNREHLLAAAASASPDAIAHVDTSGRIAAVNPACEALFGYPEHELRGRPLELLLPERVRASKRQLVLRALAGAAVTVDEGIGCRREGTEFPLLLALSPVRDAGDRLIGLSATIRDATE
jgi:PAS domain S-box-containing protein